LARARQLRLGLGLSREILAETIDSVGVIDVRDKRVSIDILTFLMFYLITPLTQ
jgi:hypothetical protein